MELAELNGNSGREVVRKMRIIDTVFFRKIRNAVQDEKYSFLWRSGEMSKAKDLLICRMPENNPQELKPGGRFTVLAASF